MLKEIDAAIKNYAARLSAAVTNAADADNWPGVGTISLLKRDLQALYELRRDEEQRAETARKIAAIK
jgi:hypothetical protein